MAATVFLDSNYHEELIPGYTALTAGAVSTTAAGTVSPTTSAGAAPTVTFDTGVDCTDRRGRFNLNAVTGGGAQAAGVVAKVRFAKPYASKPAAIIVTLNNDTDTTAAIVVSSNAVTVAGFDVCVGTALTTAKVYKVDYLVVP